MRLKFILPPILFFLVISCDFRSDNPALWTIGKNKKEFQKVYDYYNKPGDSLKLKAAEFLIKNINNHYYYVLKNQDKVDGFYKTIINQISVPLDTSNIKMYPNLRRSKVDALISKGLENGSLPRPKYRMRTDIKNIDAEFLIENIEYAFKAWNFPWSKGYSFDDFCKYILPYRYGNEAPSSWRKEIFEKYKWIADSLENGTSLEAAVLINKQFQNNLTDSKLLKDKGIKLKISSQFDLNIFADCIDESGLGVSVLRALGIPAAVIVIPNWGNWYWGHETTGIFNLENEWSTFDFGYDGPIEKKISEAPKLFIKQFDKMRDFKPILEDVTGILMDAVDLEVKVNAEEKDEIYLCVFGDRRWFPLSKGENMKTKVIFKDVGYRELMFIAAVKSKGKLRPVSQVFLPDSLGNITYLIPEKTKKFSTTLNRKYPGIRWGNNRLKSLIEGEFSIADSKDFLNKKQLFKIDTILEYRDNIIKVPKQSGKFVRYDFPQSSESNFDGPAEISFYTTNQGKLEKIKGKHFGSPQLSQEHIKIMTDNDVLNYVEVWDYQKEVDFKTDNYILRKDKQPIWIGMEMDSITTVTHIGICPRNDKNGIYPGMNYELRYWDNTWVSLGVKKAISNSITYDGIPENSLLWLRNLDEGKEERIFTLVDGEQVWW